MIFAKAEARAARGEPAPQGPAPDGYARLEGFPPETPAWSGDLDEARLEYRLRLFAVPGALFFFWLLAHGGLHMLMRTFLSMWVHEVGHAVAAWFCGHLAFPGPWLTPIGSSRSVFVVLVLAGLLVFWAIRSYRAERFATAVVAGLLLVLQLGLTLGLGHTRAFELFIFAGDGGLFVLGALLVATFYLPPEHPLRREWLRWGFLVIGAAAIADGLSTWWPALHDVDVIPFGQNEGVGLSDPSKLTQVYGWTVRELVHRYVALSIVCLAALAVLYAYGLVSARRELLRAGAKA